MYRSADQDWCVMVPRGGGAPMSTYTLSLPTKTVVAPNSIPLNPESCCSPKLKLLFSYCERLFHLDLAAVMYHDVLERFISPICLCALNLSHHILEDSRTISTVTGVNALLGVWRNRTSPQMNKVEILTMPSKILPNTTCLPSSHGVWIVVMKNWEPLVSLPALAMLSQPGP